jgi:hypothetical protein
MPHEPSELQGHFGLISQNDTGTTYVESTHWSAILSGVRYFFTYFHR